MNNEQKNNDEMTETPENGVKNFTLLYIAIGCFAVSCVLFALAFVIKYAGVYMLIASMICSLASVSFLNGQKRRAYNKFCFVLRILSYAIMLAALAVFIIGTVVARS